MKNQGVNQLNVCWHHTYEPYFSFKIKLSLRTPWMCIGEGEVYLHSSFTSILDGNEWYTLHPGLFKHPGKQPLLTKNRKWDPDPANFEN
jgi:hypothetical protein